MLSQWILILEDEKDLRDLLSEEFTQAGFRVLSTGKAAEAVRILRNQKFSCVLLDMRLEGGSGAPIIFSLREDKASLNFSTPILVMSGQLNVELVLKIKDMVTGVFVKPFDLSTLINKVNTVCSLENAET